MYNTNRRRGLPDSRRAISLLCAMSSASGERAPIEGVLDPNLWATAYECMLSMPSTRAPMFCVAVSAGVFLSLTHLVPYVTLPLCLYISDILF